MNSRKESPLVVGVDVGGPQKGFHAVALRGPELIAKFQSADASAVVRWCMAQNAEAVAVDAPCQWRQPGGPARAAELELAREGISSFSTPTLADAEGHTFYTWMFAGQALFKALQVNYPLYGGGSAVGRICLETFPQAVACALAGRIVSAKGKNAVRREILRSAGVDPTRLANIDEIDAALCALAATSLLTGSFRSFGDTAGGFLVVPSGNIQRRSLPRPKPTSNGTIPAVGPATAEIERKVGRLILDFQHLELMLKLLLSQGNFQGTIRDLEKVFRESPDSSERRTLGLLTNTLAKFHLGSLAEPAAPDPGIREIHFSFQFTLGDDKASRTRFLSRLKQLVEARNTLVHVSLLSFDFSTPEGRTQATSELESQAQQLAAMRQDIAALVQTAKKALAAALKAWIETLPKRLNREA